MTDLSESRGTHVVVLLGSLRADSYNRRIAQRLQAEAPDGVTVRIATGLADLPFYNEEIDTDADLPAAARALRDQVAAADRVLAVTPEYNGTMPAVLNNAIDWLSRPYGVGALQGKPFGVVGATPTQFGGKWSHEDARRSATIAGADVVPDLVLSHSTLDADVFEDPDVFARFLGALVALVEHRPAADLAA
ncbi:NAD(P)H-dependent oxidoreductase [Nocardioides sp.]|jgi:NAD(P)H-dependent FMN reductase|uniref:NAD(P)H-dependent oxidoreductase n=1 Tax=Nocardioides sp. TaxID=35761 RepID=UPI002F401420